MRKLRSVMLAIASIPGVARAHHGLDFVLVETAHLPESKSGYVFGRLTRFDASESETEIEPAALWGMTDRVALEAHAHYAKEDGGSFEYESVAPAVHFRLSPMGKALSFGVSAEYAFESGHDGRDVVVAAGVVGYERNGWIAAGNLLLEKRSGSSGEWGYAAGIRRTLTPKHGVGLELRDAFDGGDRSEVLIGYYGELAPRFSVTAGIGSGIDEGPDHTAHATLIWRFK